MGRAVALATFDARLGRDWAGRVSEHWLLGIGRIAAPTDYAIAHYLDPWHPKFYRQRSELEKAVRRALARPTFPDRVQRLVDKIGTVEWAAAAPP